MVGSMNWNKNKINQRLGNQFREEKKDLQTEMMLNDIKDKKNNEAIRSLNETQKFEIYGDTYNSLGICKPTRQTLLRHKDQNVDVKCHHCNREYTLMDMVFEHRFGMNDPLWWCKHPTCDGAGYGFDILPVSNKRKPNLERLIETTELLNKDD